MKFVNSYKEKIKKYNEKHHLTYHIDTMGCSMNENDSNKYAGILESMGFEREDDEKKANLILFNTCCIRENAEKTLFGRIGALKRQKLKNKDVYIAVVGCMTQQKHIIEKIKESYRFVDIVLGTSCMSLFPEKVYESIIQNNSKIEYIDVSNNLEEEVPIKYEDQYRASVSIIYGCNNFCSYCIVPYVRGRERSREKEAILADIKKLAKAGYKEITLLGQNVNSYGNDLKEKYTFPMLLKDIEAIDGIEIIKFISPHPKDFKEDLIEVIKSSKKIARQIHLPLQSGSTKILKEMNRKYTKDEFLEIVKKLKEADESISISTDIIVGFPGETEEDFMETLDVVKKVQFNQIYMFIYSKRNGTKAASMQDDTLPQEKVKRLQRLKKFHEEQISNNNRKMIGQVYQVLVEGKSKTNETLYTGRTSQNKIVIFEASDKEIGKIKNIKIESDHLWYLKGKIE
ncbi:MAG: tRNA (N6-isopentenyl adenosine(37)-C2)-methylthiotransferase MiaB [Clostridia bacterium]|nr:tRNA (N6-isopentenyl adenosine(37)-C2)-methylthiotransferase MiaB [Clostridia bacterium]